MAVAKSKPLNASSPVQPLTNDAAILATTNVPVSCGCFRVRMIKKNSPIPHRSALCTVLQCLGTDSPLRKHLASGPPQTGESGSFFKLALADAVIHPVVVSGFIVTHFGDCSDRCTSTPYRRPFRMRDRAHSALDCKSNRLYASEFGIQAATP